MGSPLLGILLMILLLSPGWPQEQLIQAMQGVKVQNSGENLGSGGTDHQQPEDEQLCDTVDLH